MVKIPGGITPEHFMRIRVLLKSILGELGTKAVFVTCRLNETGKEYPRPFFVGFVESQIAQNSRESKNRPDPGLFRFGDDLHTQIYADCIMGPKAGIIQTLTWPDGLTREIFSKSLYLDGLTEKYRKNIAIRVGNRYVGTLNGGFSELDPNADAIMERHAQTRSALVQFFTHGDLTAGLDGLEFGGPICP